MDDRFATDLSSHDHESITVRERDLASEVMGELSFPAALFYLWTGEEPTDGETRLLDAILSSLMVHGTTPAAIAARMTALSEPNAPQAAIASGILGVGSRYAGPMKECSEVLGRIADAKDSEAALAEFVDAALDEGEAFPGIGHPHLSPVDPRAETLFEIADEEDLPGEHTELLREIQNEFEDRTGDDLPINVVGAIGALTADLGLSPTAARGLAVVSRAAGVTGAVLEEEDDPMATDIWQAVDQGLKDS